VRWLEYQAKSRDEKVTYFDSVSAAKRMNRFTVTMDPALSHARLSI